MSIFKKITDNTFERTDERTEITILDKEQLEKSKKFLEREIAKFQVQLNGVNNNLIGIEKAK